MRHRGAEADKSDNTILAALALLSTVPTDRALAGWQPFREYRVRAYPPGQLMTWFENNGTAGPVLAL